METCVLVSVLKRVFVFVVVIGLTMMAESVTVINSGVSVTMNMEYDMAVTVSLSVDINKTVDKEVAVTVFCTRLIVIVFVVVYA